MCGICGIYNYGSRIPADRHLVEAMNQCLLHRGPDDDGFFIDGPLALAMRRLSIIDLTTGQQPIHNEDSTIQIVFNGEIYNFPEVRQHLEQCGHSFYSHSDTEVIVHAYEQWGDDCVLHLNGIFAFSLWDARRQRLLIARDHFGVKPLYYYDDGTRLLWGSEIKALLADPTVPRDVDTAALDLFLAFQFVPSPATMFRGIRKLAPGHRLIVDSHGLRVEHYWHPSPSADPALTELDYIELLRTRLESAVRRQMISDVPVGALLSGGVDSAVIVAIMTQLTNHPVQTFTVGFTDGGSANELADARATAVRLGTEHHDILLDKLDYEHMLHKVMWRLEEPMSSTSPLPMYIVCQLARQNVTVVLTGQGADEPHAGYHRYLGERYGPYYRVLPPIVRNQFIRPLVEALPRQERMKRAVRSLGTADVSLRFSQVYSTLTEPMRVALWLPSAYRDVDMMAPSKVVDYWRRNVRHMEPLPQMAYVDARLSLSDHLLLYGDKMSMATSIEARVPFLDLDYMAVAESLPARLRLRGLTRKYIHKQAISKWIDKEIMRRPKRGFETPMDTWFRSELSSYVRDALLGADSACRIYFHEQALSALLMDHVQGRQSNHRLLFSLLMFELWHRQFITGDPLSAP